MIPSSEANPVLPAGKRPNRHRLAARAFALSRGGRQRHFQSPPDML